MDSILKKLKENPHLKLIADNFKNHPQEIYLVGGYLRDLFLKRKKENMDFDFAVSSQAIKISRAIAGKLKSGFVVLDKEHGSSRIVYAKNGFSYNFDFTDFRGLTALSTGGRDIFADLLHRDFTINSLALNLRAIKNARTIDTVLLDPYFGRADIKARLIRTVSDFSLPEDPLRILRAFSLAAALDFKIETKTKDAIRKHKKKINSSAFERITEELFKILNSENGFRSFKAMDDFGLLDEIMPEIKVMRGVGQGPYHHLDVYGHSLEALKQIERLFSELKRNRAIQDYLNKIISGTHTKKALLKLGSFLHDIGKPASKERINGKTCFHGHERIGRNIAREMAERLRLSNDEKNALDKMIFWHLRPGYIADIENLTERAIYRFFRDAQDEAVSILLLSIADQRSTRGPLTRGANRRHHEDVCLGLTREFFRKAKEKKLPPLVNGYDIMRHLKLPPGPLIGKILEEISEAQAAGELKTKPQALELARSQFTR
ncbi:MAG: hypothetical protein A3J51_03420 [Omnitrophica WOR_2 bacterium RIFCSPHIGHO2_02_FULL_45_21]|nr:MAG: hypothetical protein A3J51_03420 [Omnitrophica WOR_2 bacterium RIFCSPHIGHO2_02_FULL_45_21]